ncbi:hypothetical protein TEA_018326 [Camellia sinensis var. sinensis]|uniref:TF-B3 domain-containing protein n=1 Tax=Camellia sinensis var. sinensis TaxID=542762 RepID=A0A4V6RYM7_CAMSN|nr:hypothetical protein TEA_018326 [Camellia sinensis var. sinensis]
MSSSVFFCFEKVLSKSDATKTILQVPHSATNLPEENKEVIVVKDQTGRKWKFEVAIKDDEKQKRLQGEWSQFTKAYGLMKGVIVKISFEKKLSEEDLTDMNIPLIHENNQPVMVVWDQKDMQWRFQIAIGGDNGNKKLLNREKWIQFVRRNELEAGETLKLRYSPTEGTYSAECEGPNRIPTRQISFEKKLSEEDLTDMNIPLIHENNQPVMVVWDQKDMQWRFQIAIGGDNGNKKMLNREKWIQFVPRNELEAGETLKLRYSLTELDAI